MADMVIKIHRSVYDQIVSGEKKLKSETLRRQDGSLVAVGDLFELAEFKDENIEVPLGFIQATGRSVCRRLSAIRFEDDLHVFDLEELAEEMNEARAVYCEEGGCL